MTSETATTLSPFAQARILVKEAKKRASIMGQTRVQLDDAVYELFGLFHSVKEQTDYPLYMPFFFETISALDGELSAETVHEGTVSSIIGILYDNPKYAPIISNNPVSTEPEKAPSSILGRTLKAIGLMERERSILIDILKDVRTCLNSMGKNDHVLHHAKKMLDLSVKELKAGVIGESVTDWRLMETEKMLDYLEQSRGQR